MTSAARSRRAWAIAVGLAPASWADIYFPLIISAEEIMKLIRVASLVLSAVAILAGAVGMPMSFLYLASRSMEDITAGTSGFVAGAVLIAGGIISLAIISMSERADSPRRKEHFD